MIGLKKTLTFSRLGLTCQLRHEIKIYFGEKMRKWGNPHYTLVFIMWFTYFLGPIQHGLEFLNKLVFYMTQMIIPTL